MHDFMLTDRMIREARPKGMPFIPELPASHGLGQEARIWLLKQYGPTTSGIMQQHMANGVDGDIEDYYRLAMYLSRLDLRSVIVDVGCGAGMQQVFFKDFAGYVGIDTSKSRTPPVLQSNASFLSGDFVELVESGKFTIESHMVGIANASLLYEDDNEEALALFKQFKRLVLV